MKYNVKYDRWVTKDGLVYRYDKNKDRLVQCCDTILNNGYIMNSTKVGSKLQHRIVWETFNGEIPDSLEIDHINTIRTDNKLDNLRVCTKSENMLNPITRKLNSESKKGKTFSIETRKKISKNLRKPRSDFGEKFFKHYGFTKRGGDINLYYRELRWYRNNNKVCRWEVEDK